MGASSTTAPQNPIGEGSVLGDSDVQLKTADGKYRDLVFGDGTLVIDGEWHSFEAVVPDLETANLLVKLYNFNGQFVITDLEFIYQSSPIKAKQPLEAGAVTSAVLKSIDPSKIKQCEQTPLYTGAADQKNGGFFVKEGGTPEYALIEKNGEMVEALYFSRGDEYNWQTYSSDVQNYGWFEFRFKTDSDKVLVGIKFDYIGVGDVESCITSKPQNPIYETVEFLGDSYVQIKTADGVYRDVVYGDGTLVLDGDWHTFNVDISGYNTSNVLVKLFHFNGEFAIANVEFYYE